MPLALQFQPPATMTTFALTGVVMAVFGFPVWCMVAEENKYLAFKSKLEEAKAAKAAQSA